MRPAAYTKMHGLLLLLLGRHVSDILADEMSGGKVLVFAHHRNVLDALEQSVVRTGRVEYIRIDGRTKVRSCLSRQDAVRVACVGCDVSGTSMAFQRCSWFYLITLAELEHCCSRKTTGI